MGLEATGRYPDEDRKTPPCRNPFPALCLSSALSAGYPGPYSILLLSLLVSPDGMLTQRRPMALLFHLLGNLMTETLSSTSEALHKDWLTY